MSVEGGGVSTLAVTYPFSFVLLHVQLSTRLLLSLPNLSRSFTSFFNICLSLVIITGFYFTSLLVHLSCVLLLLNLLTANFNQPLLVPYYTIKYIHEYLFIFKSIYHHYIESQRGPNFSEIVFHKSSLLIFISFGFEDIYHYMNK